MNRHLAWSREFGIDAWICSWWGPDSWEDATLRRHVLPELERERSTDFCIFYEAQGLLGLDPEKGIEFDAANSERFISHFRFLADHYFPHPSYQRIEGRPVVYLYLSRAFSGHFERALLRARAAVAAKGHELYLIGDEVYWGDPDPERLAHYDAVTSYNMHGPLPFAGMEDWRGFVEDCGEVYGRYRSAAATAGVGFIPGVLPAFDTSGRHYPIPRAIRPGAGGHSFLEAMLEMARSRLDPALRTIAVTSFNEWHEGTQVEPSEHGDNGGGTLRRFKNSAQAQ